MFEATGNAVQFPDDDSVTGTDVIKQVVKFWTVLDGRLFFHVDLVNAIFIEGVDLKIDVLVRRTDTCVANNHSQ